VLTHAAGSQSLLHTTLFSNTPGSATIAGTAATVTIPGPFYVPGAFRITFHAGPSLDYQEDAIGYAALPHQVAHVARSINDGVLESPLRPLVSTLTTIQVIDEVRRPLGIVFNEERQM
jgi:hypothetical protein